MARFSRALTQALTQPSYQQGLFTAGQMAGQAPAAYGAVQEAKRQKAGQTSMLTQAVEGPVDKPEDMLKGILSTAAQTGADPAQALAAYQNRITIQQETHKRRQQGALRSIAELSRRAPGDEKTEQLIATLSSKYNLDPKEVFAVKATPKEKAKVSTHAQRLLDAGYEQGTPVFEAQMKKYIEKLNNQTVINVQAMNPLQSTEFLQEQLTSNPEYKANQEQLTRVARAESLLSELRQGNSVSARLVEREVSNLFNGDTRAASEITRMLEGKGITTNIKDWASTAFQGDVSEESKNHLRDILTIARNSADQANNAFVEGVTDLYGANVDPEVVNNWRGVALRTPAKSWEAFVNGLTEEQKELARQAKRNGYSNKEIMEADL